MYTVIYHITTNIYHIRVTLVSESYVLLDNEKKFMLFINKICLNQNNIDQIF